MLHMLNNIQSAMLKKVGEVDHSKFEMALAEPSAFSKSFGNAITKL